MIEPNGMEQQGHLAGDFLSRSRVCHLFRSTTFLQLLISKPSFHLG